MVKDKKLYDVLEVDSSADETTIKKAYTRLSKIYHPDKNLDNKEKATQKFQEINQAKEVLLDSEKRNLYDQIGMDIFNMGSNNQEDHGFGGGFPGGFPGFGGGFPGFGGGFPGFGGGFGGNQRKSPEAEDIIEKLNITLEQIYNEENVQYTYNYRSFCADCNGEGTKDGITSICAVCQGKGIRTNVVRMGNIIQQSHGPCGPCRGKGSVIKDDNKCKTCDGKTYIIKTKTSNVKMKAGLASGNKITLQGRGHQLKNIKTDLILVLKEVDHKTFKRHENDLFIEVELKLYQALFGFEKMITHLDKRELHLSCSGQTAHGTIRKISGEGMKTIHSKTMGDLYIKFVIGIPDFTNLPTDTKNQLKAILQTFDKPETLLETQIQANKSLIKTVLLNCNNDDTKVTNTILFKLENTTHNDTSEEHQEERPGNCTHQ